MSAPKKAPPAPISELGEAIKNSPALDVIRKQVNNLPISADAKALVMKIAQVSVRVGERMIRIGRLILGFVLDLANRYPNTAFALILTIVVTTLIGFIPWVGPFLAGFFGPLLGVLTLIVGGISDMRARALLTRTSAQQAALEAQTELLDKLASAEKSGLLDRLPELTRLFDATERDVVLAGGAKNVG